ncbi:MAG: ribose 5-phosphate isomerase B [Calditrichia bacterium]
MFKSIAIASDHAGFVLKAAIKNWLEEEKIHFTDFGTFTPESCDYPDYAIRAAESVKDGEHEAGIVICGSGIGVSISANKVKGIRAALCWKKELATLARQHNNANVLALPARFIEEEKALEIVKAFLVTEFEGGRHSRRVDKIHSLTEC